MTNILCRWLNEELQLSQVVEPETFAKSFSSGFLIGEVLHKYQLQNDFSMFTKKDTSISRVNNFTRLEPTLQLLGVSFDINTAQELMQEKQGVATRLLYQLYVSLEKMKKAQISGTVMEIMQPAAKAVLHKKEHEIYSGRLHQVVKRDAELKLQKISQHYEEKCQQWNERSVLIHPILQKRQPKLQDVQRMKNFEKVPKPPPYTSQLSLKRRQCQEQRRAQDAQMVQSEIAQFETNKKKLVTYGFAPSLSGLPFPGNITLGGNSIQGCNTPGRGTKLVLQSNSKYMQEIRQRLKENASTREQREKRQDRFLVEQFKAHEAQEEARRDELLVKRLTRQTKQEQRLAAQLLHIRHEKEVIRRNRLFLEQQIQQRRLRDFQESLEREAALARHAKLAKEEEIKQELELCNRIAAERAQSRYKKHFATCKDIVEQIVDLATKVGEYRLLTRNLIPEKKMREWKELLFSGLPLYEPIKGQQPGFEFSTPLDPVELKKQEILNNQDYDEYINMVGQWAWPEEAGETKLPLTNNNILGHIVVRLRDIVHQPVMEPSAPSFPHFTLKACVLGNFCSGKTTCLAKIAEAHGIYVLSAYTLTEEALNAFRNGEEVTEQQEEKDDEQLLASDTSPKPGQLLDTEQQEEKDNEQLLTSTASPKPDPGAQEETHSNDTEQQEEKDNEQLLTSTASPKPDPGAQEETHSNVTEQQEEKDNEQLLASDTLPKPDPGAQEETHSNATEQQEEKDNKQLLASTASPKPDPDTQEESIDSNIRLSTRAKQGAAAEKELRKGKTIPNELLVDIVVEAIRQLPPLSGWILDGFPMDITQAYLLEKALGGSVDVENDVVSSRTTLAADPNPPKSPPPPAPVLDLALLLDVPDECVVRRAFSQADTAAAETSDPTDRTLYLGQISYRIEAFQDTCPQLEKWFGGKQNILVHVDADVDEEELYKRVESVIQPVMMQTQKGLATNTVEDVVLDSEKAPDSSSSATAPPVDQPPALTDAALGPTESHSSLNEEKAQSVKSLSQSNTHSPGGLSRRGSTSNLTNEDSQGVPKNPPESASPCPASSSWIFVDELLPQEIPEYLCSHWDAVCDSYVNNIKTVMQQMRSQCTIIDHDLYKIREEYKHFLGRPDLRQELVSQWQKDFNGIPDDMREDEETKAELHLRLDELCERLWDVSDKRKEMNEQEKGPPKGWLEEHTAVLINHHSILMQVELDRFQATLCFLRVYYLSMYCQVLPELPSNFIPITLLDTSEIKDQDKIHPDSTVNGQTEPAKPPHEKLISDYEEVLTTISKMVAAEAHQVETKQEKRPQKENTKASASANKTGKGRQSSKKQKGPPSPPPAPSPAPADDENSKTKNKIHQEYAAALAHEENAAKVRIALVKGHGLVMVHSLQSRTEQTLSSMQEWLEAHYLAEMKSIEQLSEVVHHHIEAGSKFKTQLVLECNNFYMIGDSHMVANPPNPPHPPAVEKPSRSTPTVTQLESLHLQLNTVAPSGLMSSFEFSSLLRDITSVNMDKNTLPEPWINKNERQLMEIVSLLNDDYELIDWRQFLLSAALPWPFPSLTQLLALLERFKTADTGDTGYINEEQYLQTESWFSNESVQHVPEDASEPLPYNRLANLRKFFFQLFADHSFSPPRLDYVSMLQYFAADSSCRQGFIRALSVVLGQHLKHCLTNHLVKSMPSIAEVAEHGSPEHDGEYKAEETLCASSSSLQEQEVSIPALLAVVCHKINKIKDNVPLPSGCLSQEEHKENLVHIFRELGYKPEDCVPFSVLSQHPFIQHLMETSAIYKLVNIHKVLLAHQDEGETDSLTVS